MFVCLFVCLGRIDGRLNDRLIEEPWGGVCFWGGGGGRMGPLIEGRDDTRIMHERTHARTHALVEVVNEQRGDDGRRQEGPQEVGVLEAEEDEALQPVRGVEG